MRVKDVWYFHYDQKECEILQPDLVQLEIVWLLKNS